MDDLTEPLPTNAPDAESHEQENQVETNDNEDGTIVARDGTTDPVSTATDAGSPPLLPNNSDETTDSANMESGQQSPSLSNEVYPDNSDNNNSANNRYGSRNPWKNHNVIVSLLLCVVAGVADSIWTSVVLSSFLLALAKLMGQSSHGNTYVGAAEAVEGLTGLIFALPVGYVADTYGKSKTVRAGGILMLFTIAITVWSVNDVNRNAIAAENDSESASSHEKEAQQSYIVLVVALGLWGIVNGISFGPSQALYSDSVANGRRSEMLTWLYTCYLLASSVGPIVSIVLILTVSSDAENWSLQELTPVFLIGVLLEIPAAILMFFFSDDHIVPEDDGDEGGSNNDTTTNLQDDSNNTTSSEEEENSDDGDLPNNTPTNVNSQQSLETFEEDSVTTVPCSNTNALEEPLLNDNSQDTMEATAAEQYQKRGKTAIPYVLFLSSLVVSLGSGASVKYFPLFFKEMGFSSAEVQGIFLAVPIFISMFSFVATRAGKHFGRIQATVVLDIIGVSLLFLMNWLSTDVAGGSSEDNSSSLWHVNPLRACVVVVVYLLRTGIMNSSYPLLESILMDNVPSNQRARWKSLESIASFGWTGSALVGGVLSDHHSYQFTFAITAFLQLAGSLLLIFIGPFVKGEGS